jgi:hypothetical protein
VRYLRFSRRWLWRMASSRISSQRASVTSYS